MCGLYFVSCVKPFVPRWWLRSASLCLLAHPALFRLAQLLCRRRVPSGLAPAGPLCCPLASVSAQVGPGRGSLFSSRSHTGSWETPDRLSGLGRSPHTPAVSILAVGGRPGTARYSWTHCSGLPELGCWSIQSPQEIPQCPPPPHQHTAPTRLLLPPGSRLSLHPCVLLLGSGRVPRSLCSRAAAGALRRATPTGILVWLGLAQSSSVQLSGALLAAAALLLVRHDLSPLSSPFALGALWLTSPLPPGL